MLQAGLENFQDPNRLNNYLFDFGRPIGTRGETKLLIAVEIKAPGPGIFNVLTSYPQP